MLLSDSPGTNTFHPQRIGRIRRISDAAIHLGLAALVYSQYVVVLDQAAACALPPTVTSTTASAPQSTSVSVPDYSDDLTGNWFGLRPRLQSRGITFSGSLETDGSYDLSGGLATHRSAYSTLLTLNISMDTKALFNLPGGTIFASYEGLWGQNGEVTQVGSLQGFDANDAAPFSALYQLYYDQMFGRFLEVRVGRQDACDFFGEPPDAQLFLNPSPTTFPTIIGSSYYPNSAPGIVAVLYPTKQLTLKFGAYYFDRFHPSALDQMLNTLEPTGQPVGTFLIAEGDYSWQINGDLPGVMALGGTWRTGKLGTLNGSIQSGGGSAYGYIDQTLWANSKNQSIAAYEIISGGDQEVSNSDIDFSSLGGFLATGLVPSRPNDQLGIAYNWAHISSQANLPKPYELDFEGFYAFNFGHGITLQPDLQYFINTGGGVYSDALVATLRVTLNF